MRTVRATALTVLTTGTAFAQVPNNFTPAGELVSNTFTLNYEVNDTPQPEIDNSGSPTVFNVDRLVNVTVETLGDTNVIENQTDVELPFVVVNNGNDTQAYFLDLEQEASSATEQFDTLGATTAPDLIYYPDAADTDGDGNLSSTERAAASALEEDYDDTNPPVVAPDERVFVFARQDIPAGQTTGDRAGVILVADTRENAAGFADVTADTDGNNANATIVENVLADLSGDGATDAATDGSHSDTGYFIVQNPEVSATKEVFGVAATAAGTCDAIATAYTKPTASTEYFTPGSCVEYVIEVVNAGSTSATDIVLTDVLPDHLVFQEAAVRGALVPGTLTDPAPATECDGLPATCTVSLSNATIAAQTGGVDTVGFLVIRALIE